MCTQREAEEAEARQKAAESAPEIIEIQTTADYTSPRFCHPVTRAQQNRASRTKNHQSPIKEVFTQTCRGRAVTPSMSLLSSTPQFSGLLASIDDGGGVAE